MNPDERNLITGLFDRLRQADRAAGNKDQEALQLIQQQTSALPSAPYLLVQTVLVQEHALNNAQTRIADLERQVAEARRGGQDQPQESDAGGGFLSGLFKKPATSQPQPPPLPGQLYPRGGGYPQDQPGGAPGAPQAPPPAPYPTTAAMPPSAGGSFLRSALGTAAGVAGGALLFQGVQNLLGQHAGPFAGGLADMGNQAATAGGSFLGGGGAAGPTEVVNNYYGDTGGQPGETVGDFADRGGGGGGGGEPFRFDDQGNPDVQNADYDVSDGDAGGGTVGDFADSGGYDDGGGFDDSSGYDDSMV